MARCSAACPLAVAIALAVAVLFVFLRSLASTLVVAAAIPISVIGTFVFMHLFGVFLALASHPFQQGIDFFLAEDFSHRSDVP